MQRADDSGEGGEVPARGADSRLSPRRANSDGRALGDRICRIRRLLRAGL
jgi:hypothetical protein